MLEINSIYNQDCLEGLRQMKKDSVKLIVAYPPYFLGMTHNGQRGSFVDLAICKPFFYELFCEMRRVLRADGEIYWFCDWRSYAFYYPIFDAVIGAKNMIVWDKLSGAGNFYAFTHELLIYGSMKVIDKKGQNIWRVQAFSSGSSAKEGKKVHPTQKPLPIIQKIVEDASKPGDLVLDPFTGSGTTAIVCKQTDRNFIGFELDIANFEVIRKRMGLAVQGLIKLEF